MQGSLRIIRNGIGITEQATIEVHGIKGLWNLRRFNDDPMDTYLVISFVNETRGLAFATSELEELMDAQIEGFDHQKQTLHCANLTPDAILQVTDREIRVIFNLGDNTLQKWSPPNKKSIIIATSSPSQVRFSLKCEIEYFV